MSALLLVDACSILHLRTGRLEESNVCGVEALTTTLDLAARKCIDQKRTKTHVQISLSLLI